MSAPGRAVAVVLAGAVALAVVAPRAQAAEPNNTALGIAHFEAGKRLYAEGRYPQALIEFSAGYELTRRPAFLINIAQCHRQMHEPREAISYYREYLVHDATSREAEAVKRVIAELEAELPPEPPPQATPPPPTVTAEQAPAPAPPPKRKRILAWAGVGTTGALLVVGGALAIAAKVRFDGDASGCAASMAGCSQAEHDGFVLENRAGNGVLIAAGVVAVATIIAAIVEARRAR